MSHGMLLTVSSLLMMPFSFGKKLLGEIAEEHALTKLKRFIGQKSPGSIEGCLDVRMAGIITIVKHAVVIVHTIGTCTGNYAILLIGRTVG